MRLLNLYIAGVHRYFYRIL